MRISSPLIGELHIGNRSRRRYCNAIRNRENDHELEVDLPSSFFLTNTIPVQRIKAARQEDASQTTAEPIIVSYRLSKSYKDFENVQGREKFTHLFVLKTNLNIIFSFLLYLNSGYFDFRSARGCCLGTTSIWKSVRKSVWWLPTARFRWIPWIRW